MTESAVISPRWPRQLQTALQLVWVALALLAVAVMAAALPVRFEQLISDAAANRVVLRNIGLSNSQYAFYFLLIDYGPFLVFAYTGFFLFTRQRQAPMTLFASAMLILVGVIAAPPVTNQLIVVHPGWQPVVALLQGAGAAAAIIFFYLFPDGRFVPGWTRWAALLWLTLCLTWSFIPYAPLNPFHEPASITVLLVSLWFSSLIYAQFFRYQHISSPSQRQQTKWVLFGLTMAILGYIFYTSLRAYLPGLQTSPSAALLFRLWGLIILNKLPLILVPLTIAFSIIHYRLWDIDFVINQALVWGVFTLTLSLVAYVAI